MPEGAVREMGECAGGTPGTTAGGGGEWPGAPAGPPSKLSVWVRCVLNEGRPAGGDAVGGRGEFEKGDATAPAAPAGAGACEGAWNGGGGGAPGAVECAGAAAPAPASCATMAFFTLSMRAWVSNGLSIESSAPALLPRVAS